MPKPALPLLDAANPFATAELRDQRALQRRVLRRIPAKTVMTASAWNIKPPQVLEAIDRAAVESEVRRLAAEAIDQLRPVLATYEVVEFGEVIATYFGDLIKQRTSDLKLGPPHVAALKDKFVKLMFEDADTLRARRESVHHVQLDEERAALLLRLVVFLLTADELAGDGYRDPRVEWARATPPPVD